MHEKKPWGTVENLPSAFSAQGKIINLRADQRTSLKYYVTLNQVLYCLSGKVLVYAPNEKEFGDITKEDGNYFTLEPGDIINIEARNPYRLYAYENSVLVEVLVGHTNQDVIMLEDDYGRANKTNGD